MTKEISLEEIGFVSSIRDGKYPNRKLGDCVFKVEFDKVLDRENIKGIDGINYSSTYPHIILYNGKNSLSNFLKEADGNGKSRFIPTYQDTYLNPIQNEFRFPSRKELDNIYSSFFSEDIKSFSERDLKKLNPMFENPNFFHYR